MFNNGTTWDPANGQIDGGVLDATDGFAEKFLIELSWIEIYYLLKFIDIGIPFYEGLQMDDTFIKDVKQKLLKTIGKV
jgi:hypothetical protein